jgi:hypothetical protein
MSGIVLKIPITNRRDEPKNITSRIGHMGGFQIVPDVCPFFKASRNHSKLNHIRDPQKTKKSVRVNNTLTAARTFGGHFE